ncbi:hypothetical protein ACFQ05_22545 [Amycolatopsis umgeniensis]|uniref:PH domain-containing protein n=2 Tax=Amycolatopsis umgeniensis TaxID=336628 RepID=A0A841AUC8_9PSEU|nr:hypothetical protein [Amycolatopsis umgeniensis]
MIAVAVLIVILVSQGSIAWWPPFGGVFVGLFFLFQQRILARRARDRALSYLVTTQRIIFVANWPTGAEFRWVWLAYLQVPHRVKADEAGLGTITFGGRWNRSRTQENELRGAWATPVLELRAIPEARRVADLIVQARNRLIGTYTLSA